MKNISAQRRMNSRFIQEEKKENKMCIIIVFRMVCFFIIFKFYTIYEMCMYVTREKDISNFLFVDREFTDNFFSKLK